VRYVARDVRAGRVARDPGCLDEAVDGDVDLHEREALLDAQLQALAEHRRVGRGRRVGIAADPVTELPAEHLVDRNVVGLARQVPQGHFNAGDAASLARVEAELLDLPEHLVHVARILADDHALEHHHVVPVGSVAVLADAVDALVRVEPDEPPSERGHPHVRDSEVAGL